jgi:ribonuclease HI
LWGKVRRCSGIYPNNQINILHHNNQTISSPIDISNTIAASFAKISSSSNYLPSFNSYKTSAESKKINFRTKRNLPYNSKFSYFEFNRALQNCHKTSSGPDNISYTLLKKLPQSSLINLLKLYNRIWQENIFPSSWRMATIVPILKPGKNATDPLSYRPIALTSCICKVLEKMINARLIHFLEANNCLSQFQSGFRKGRSTVDNIIDLETRIRNAFVKRKHLVSIFFDIEKAYDRTWRYGILQQLYNHNLRGNLPVFIQNFLSKRFFRVRIGNTLSDIFIQEEGVPQGSVLSVTLFIVAIDKILLDLPSSVTGNLYVDDLHISCEGTDICFIERQLQGAVNRILNWSNKNGFTISRSKTCGVHFCRKRRIHPDPEIHLDGGTISIENEVKFLGIIFDRKLSFRPHILHLRKKCQRSLNILKVLSNTSWGADRSSLLKIYHAVIRSKLDYGCVVYGSTRKTYLQKLNTVHHTALRLCSGAFRTSPIESLYVDCCEAPLDLRRKILTLNYFFNISSHANHPFRHYSLNPYIIRLYNARRSCIQPFHLRIRDILNDFNFHNTEILVAEPYGSPWEDPKFSFINPFKGFAKTCTADIIYQQLFRHHRERVNNYIPVFTDGSKSENFVGCAYVIGTHTFKYKLHTAFSVFSAELLAIFKAMEEIERQQNNANFIFYTDSLSSLEALSSPHHHSHPLISHILNLLDKLKSRGFSIRFCWVPSHVGIQGNEEADRAAKSASNYMNFPLPHRDAKNYLKVVTQEKWQRTWDTLLHNKLRSIKDRIEYWNSQQSRREDVVITRLRIGHARYTHRHLLLGETAPTCVHCNVIMSVKHILVECPLFNNSRFYHLKNRHVILTDLLGITPHPDLFTFIKSIGFYPHV